MARQVRSNKNVRNKPQRNGVKKPINRNRNGLKSKLRSNPRSSQKFRKPPAKVKPNVQDARQKIIQKKRTVVTDARDVLANRAKTQDARNKLDKIRSFRGGITTKSGNASNANVKVIGSNILQKVDRNGKISLVTNKSRNTSTMNMAIQKQLGLLGSSRPQLKRTPPKKPLLTKASVPLRKTIVNEMNYGLPVVEPIMRAYDTGLYKWVKPDLRPASHLISSLEPTRQAMRDVMREELLMANRGWSDLVTPKPLRLQPSGYIDLDAIDDDEEMTLAHSPVSRIALKGSTRISNVHSRLDKIPNHPGTHGILSQAKTKVVVPAGHRIVVSNLQSSVTEDDIKELFEDIGQLLSAKLVRSGVAEVIYKNLKDAQKAVDTYHNRQLDGQPMKCLLVNKRPLHQPTGAPLPKSEGLLRRSSSSADSMGKLVPDISTIHKVLFQRK